MNSMNGLLLIDKPEGCTSHDVVARARRILGMRGIGHSGTLDPMASGLMVLLLGEATKISDYVLNGDKGYSVRVRLGLETDSDDRTGKVLKETAVSLEADALRSQVSGLQGELLLAVPKFSATRVEGRKLYEYARREQDVELPRKVMNFYTVDVNALGPDWVEADLTCSKGSYVRSWAAELGRQLGVGGCVDQLRRTLSSPYTVDMALSLEDLETRWAGRDERLGADLGATLGRAWVPLAEALPSWRRLAIQGQDEYLMRNGQISNRLKTRLLPFILPGHPPPGVKVVSENSGDLVSLLVAEAGHFYKIRRVFRNA